MASLATFKLRVRAEGVDPIRSLRMWLRRGLRDYALRCLSIEEEKTEATKPTESKTKQEETSTMPLDLSDAGPQSSRDPIPAGVYRLRAKLKIGTAGTDFVLHPSKNSPLLGVSLECTVIGGEHAGRKIFDWISAELDEGNVPVVVAPDKLENWQTAVRMGRAKLAAIIDSAIGLDPNDRSEAAQARRRQFDGYDKFDGVVFCAQVEVRPKRDGFQARNEIYFIVTPDDPAYAKAMTNSGSLPATSKRDSRDEMDDEVPY
jgi:hypothetical protein